nr:MAG: recombination endonuclease VII [Bacteriophage sp.]
MVMEEKVRIESKVYSNQKFMFGNELVKFTGRKAEVSKETWEAMQASKYPGVFLEGKMPATNTKLEIELTDDIKRYKQEMEAEVSRLKNIIEAQGIEIGKAKKEALDWRNLCAELQKGAKMPEIKDEKSDNGKEDENPTLAEGETSAEDELRKELKTMKVDELKTIALETEGIEPSDIEGKKKDEIIDLLVTKTTK